MSDIIYARLFNFFIDMLYIFTNNFKSFNNVIYTLITWISLNRTFDWLKKMRLKIIIIKWKIESNSNSTYDFLQSKNMNYNLRQQFLIKKILLAFYILSIKKYRRLRVIADWKNLFNDIRKKCNILNNSSNFCI